MGMVVFGILVVLGFLLSMSASVTQVVQAFHESLIWGLVVLGIPGAIFVFVASFWKKRGISRVFLLGIGGAVLSVGSTIGFIAAMPADQRNAVFAREGYADERWDGELQPYETQSLKTRSHITTEPFAEGIRFATQAANQVQAAQTAADWQAVASDWGYAIALMQSVPSSDPNFETAQQKVEEYAQNLNYASENQRRSLL